MKSKLQNLLFMYCGDLSSKFDEDDEMANLKNWIEETIDILNYINGNRNMFKTISATSVSNYFIDKWTLWEIDRTKNVVANHLNELVEYKILEEDKGCYIFTEGCLNYLDS